MYFLLIRAKIGTEFGDILNKLQARMQNFSKKLEATSKSRRRKVPYSGTIKVKSLL
jgi:hypothetical protein